MEFLGVVMENYKKYLSFWVIFAGIFGYVLSMLIGAPEVLGDSIFQILMGWVGVFKGAFFSALKMLVVPLVFFSLLSGLMQIAEVAQVGSLGKYALTYYFGTTIIAISIGLFVVFFVHPWTEFQSDGPQMNTVVQSKSALLGAAEAPKKKVDEAGQTTAAIIGKLAKRVFVNPIKAFSENNILGVVFWAFLIGLAFIYTHSQVGVLKSFVDEVNGLLNKILSWVILFSPLGVFAIAFDFQVKFSTTIIAQLVAFCVVVFLATGVHGFIVLPMILKKVTGIGFREFFKKAIQPMVFAFSTSSSAATLPISMKTCEEEFGVSPSSYSFVLPLGATMNMDGTALFEGVAAVFLAYVFGIDLSTIAMISLFLMAVISSVGAPGMPSGSMSGMQMVLIAAGIPLEGIGILLVVEKLLDTFRTAINVEGDIIGALVVDHLIKRNT